jgi:hypothetical protein
MTCWLKADKHKHMKGVAVGSGVEEGAQHPVTSTTGSLAAPGRSMHDAIGRICGQK